MILWADKLKEDEHLGDVVEKLSVGDCDRLYSELDGLSSADVSRLKEGTNTNVNVELEAENVFLAWKKSKGAAATRQAVLTALGKCKLNLAKENLEDLWETGIQ